MATIVRGPSSLREKFHRPIALASYDAFVANPNLALVHATACKVATLIYAERLWSHDEPDGERCSAGPVAVVLPAEEYLRLIGPKPP